MLDFSLSIEQLLRDYPNADFIASAEIKLGLINTGVMILRNTQWTRSLLAKWWTVAEHQRTAVCDQDAFDMVYQELLREQALEKGEKGTVDKIVILSTDALNSHPPAWMHQTPSNAVLHLMGESSLFRAAVFRKGFSAVCAARSGGMLLTQLGLDADTMLDFAV